MLAQGILCCQAGALCRPLPTSWLQPRCTSAGCHSRSATVRAFSSSVAMELEQLTGCQSNQLPSGVPQQAQSQLQQQQQQQQQQQEQQPRDIDYANLYNWTKQMSAAYFRDGRNWAAVEDFYMQLVSGRQSLSAVGLDPPAAQTSMQQDSMPQQQQHRDLQHQQDQQQQANGSAGQDAPSSGSKPTRVTYKLQLSYLGGSFSGWMRGNAHSKPSVQDTLGRAVAATGVTDRADFAANTSKRAASRSLQKAQAKKLAAAAAAAAAASCDGGPGEVFAAAMSQMASKPAQGAVSAAAAAAVQAATVVHDSSSLASSGAAQAAAVSGQQPDPLPTLPCGGRTDAGVSAIGQTASFYSWQPPLPGQELVNRINTQLQAQWEAAAAAAAAASAAHNGSGGGNAEHDGSSSKTVAEPNANMQQCQLPPLCPLMVWQAELVPRQFHATFAATWRRYVYLLPLKTPHYTAGTQQQQQLGFLPRYTSELHPASKLSPEQQAAVAGAPDVDPALVNTMLQGLQGRRINYYAYARDTPKGKDCECTLLLARASVVWLPTPQCQQQEQQQQQQACMSTQAGAVAEGPGLPCLAVELVGDRFLRRMVRVLVGTVVREAVVVRQQQQQQQLEQGRCDQLLQLAEGMDRRATAGPAPALGLCFADAGYDTFVGN